MFCCCCFVSGLEDEVVSWLAMRMEKVLLRPHQSFFRAVFSVLLKVLWLFCVVVMCSWLSTCCHVSKLCYQLHFSVSRCNFVIVFGILSRRNVIVLVVCRFIE